MVESPSVSLRARTRTNKVLKKMFLDYSKFETVKDLVQVRPNQILKCKNVGRKTLGEIMELLGRMDLKLGMVLGTNNRIL